jgi:hypothetical protein
MAGILDAFDNPNFLSQLFGDGMPSYQAPQPPPPPPGNGGIGSDAGQAPGAPQPAGIMPMPPRPPQPQNDPNAFAIKPDYTQPPAQPPIDANAIPGAFGSDPANAPMPQGQPQQTATLPMPPPRPPMGLPQNAQVFPGQAGGALPPNSAPAAAPGPPMNILPPGAQQPPMGAQPAPRPPASEFVNPPQGATTGGGMQGAFGLNRPTLQAGLAGIGKGLSAVGAQPLGASKGQAFAAGAGGSLTGTSDQQNKHFDQLSTAFKDVMLAKNSGDNADYKKAQATWLTARAQSLAAMTAKGGAGSNAWQNTPLGQVATIEQRVAAYDGPRRKSIDAAVRSGALSQEDAKKQYETLDKQVDGFRGNMYKSAGLDPAKAEKLRTAGEKSDNPIDTKGMTLEQFHAQVPLGGWFTDQNGKVWQRTVPPPGSQSQAPSQPGAQADATGDAEADHAAMTEAA